MCSSDLFPSQDRQVGKDKKKALKYKEKAIEKLSTLVEEQNTNNIPGKDYNALRRSLEEEIKAYDEIIAGREPNLDWFNDKENKPLEPTARPLEKAVDTDKPQPFKYPERELYDENNPKPTGMDWTPDVSPEQLAREKAEYERRNSFDGIVEENQRKQRAFEEEQKRRQNEPPDRGLTFNTSKSIVTGKQIGRAHV